MKELYLFFIAVKEQWRRLLTGSLTLALVGLVQGMAKLRIPGYVYWMVFCFTLFWSFFGAWRKERAARGAVERVLPSSEEIKHANATLVLAERLMQMMHDWPQSAAVTNPFTVGWRPLVGQTDIPIDQQKVMEWRRDCEPLLAEVKRNIGNNESLKDIKLFGVLDQPNFRISSLDCLSCLSDIEKLLLRKLLNRAA